MSKLNEFKRDLEQQRLEVQEALNRVTNLRPDVAADHRDREEQRLASALQREADLLSRIVAESERDNGSS